MTTRLAGRDEVTVTLVNARPVFVERIRLHQPAIEARHPGATRLPAAFGDRRRRRMLAGSDTVAAPPSRPTALHAAAQVPGEGERR